MLPVANAEVDKVLSGVADSLEIGGENPFRGQLDAQSETSLPSVFRAA